MAPRRRRRPWYRTRAYRLARTAVLVTVLVAVGSRCGGHDGPAAAGRAGGADEAAAPPATDWLDWRWVLFVNVPIGVLIAALAPLYINES
ncbi:hypothetical protein AB0B38_31725, partial [Streptomyces eurythermus]